MFVRQDISVAQQLVQSVHVAFKAGKAFADTAIDSENVVMIGVPDKEALLDIMDQLTYNAIEFVWWEESYLNQGLISVCSQPLENSQRNIFNKFKLWEAKGI